MTNRERSLTDTFVTLADTLVSDFDVAGFLYVLVERCASLFEVDQAGLLLADPSGGMQVMASTSEAAHVIEVLEVEGDEGPCMECFATGRPINVPDLTSADARKRWPRFVEPAVQAGFSSMTALPMRLRSDVIGALDLFRADPGDMPESDMSAAQALADVATIGLVQERAIRDARVVIDQLQGALNSRIVIEQAKGIVSQRLDTSMGDAFDLIRAHARDTNQRLSTVCEHLVDGSLDPPELTRSRSV